MHAVHSLVHDGAGAPERRTAEVLSFASVSGASSPAVKLVNSTVYDAVKAAASDIHLESTPSGITIKYRLDGVLDTVAQISGVALAEQVISRLKVLAELDIAERRIPQDGSFRVEAQGATSTCGCRSCRASTARTPSCASSTSAASSRRTVR
jgi:general secretion pathway protein E